MEVLLSQVAALTETEMKLQRSVEKMTPQTVSLLEKMVNINSGTLNLKGVKKAGKLVQRELRTLGFKTRWTSPPKEMKRSGHLIASKAGLTNTNRILIIGHLDTVFSKTSSFQRYSEKDGFAYGPGINDMKGGIAVIIGALTALKEYQLLDDLNISIILIGDEEKPGKSHYSHTQASGRSRKKIEHRIGI